jgi:hypothetical protein
MGTLACWELAALLRGAGRRPLEVIAPLPAVTQWVNDKTCFSRTAARLLGKPSVPRYRVADNLALLAEHVRELVEVVDTVGVKLPDAAGGGGNILVDSDSIRGRSLREIRELLAGELAWLPDAAETHVLATAWESGVTAAPSSQLWIPPICDGAPVVEGVFESPRDAPGPHHSGVGRRLVAAGIRLPAPGLRRAMLV